MAEAFKDKINRESVGVLADGVGSVCAEFSRERFVREAVSGLEPLELKDRIRHVAGALHASLPLEFPAASGVLREASGKVRFDMWSGWPATEYVGVHGVSHLDEGMGTIAVLTPYSTGEFAVRPFLERYGDDALAIMRGWASSSDEHLRRLASEGARPRLPWGSRVRWLMAFGPTLPVLETLRDDPSEFVRRSVANHVNDLAKDHPEAVVAMLSRWRAEGGSHVEPVVRHAARGLLRAGHPGALALFGAAGGNGTVSDLTFVSDGRDSVAVGEQLRFKVSVTASEPGTLVLKYAMRREGSRRVFHLGERTATVPGQEFSLTKSHSFRPVTTRSEPPGPRILEIVVNGTIRAEIPFTLIPTPAE